MSTRSPGRLRVAAAALAAIAVLVLTAGAAPARAVKLYRSYFTTFSEPFNLPFPGIGGLAGSPDGAYVYVGTGAKVIQYTTAGVWVKTWSPTFGEITGLATDTSGDLYVVDKSSGQVQIFDKNEKHLSTWSVPGVQQIASDSVGHVYLLISVLLGWVVDVRTYAGADQGAWSATLPDSFRIPSYTPGATSAIRALAADPAGDVFLAGISTQRLEGEGQDCHNLLPKDQYEYSDPLNSGEIARYTRTGEVTGWGWLNGGTRSSCYPPFHSDGQPLGLAAAPDDHNAWVINYPSYMQQLAPTSPAVPIGETIEEPCSHCGAAQQVNFPFYGPEAFDCHGDLFVGSAGVVIEMMAFPALSDCHSKLTQVLQLTLAPAITLTPQKVKKKKGKALSFEAGCIGLGCSIEALVHAKRPHCHHGNCTILLGHGRFTLKPGAHTFSLALTRGDEALLRANPRLPMQLSARLLKKGKPFGPIVLAGRGRPLVALPAVQTTLSCPAQASLGSQIALSGSLGMPHTHTLTLAVASPGGHSTQQLTTNASGGFTLSLAANAAGAWTFAATYAGDRTHAPAGAGCATYVPYPPPPPSHRKGPPPPPPPPPPPAETKLELTCRAKGTEGPFTGKITPVLPGVQVSVTYEYRNIGSKEALTKLVHHVTTSAEGTFSDQPTKEEINVDKEGTAVASWAGNASYAGATSPSCEFMP